MAASGPARRAAPGGSVCTRLGPSSMSPRALTAVVAILATLAVGGCGDDGDSEPAAGEAEGPATTEVVESEGELPAELVGEIETVCGDLVFEIGSLPAPDEAGTSPQDHADRVDELQAAALEALAALSGEIPEAQRPAWDAYLATQEAAFELSPPPTAGEPQPELDAASAAAEAQAAELGFASCSSV